VTTAPTRRAVTATIVTAAATATTLAHVCVSSGHTRMTTMVAHAAELRAWPDGKE